MKVVVGLLLAMPAWALPSKAFETLKTEFEKIEAETNKQMKDDADRCRNERNSIQGRINLYETKKDDLENDLIKARSKAMTNLAKVEEAEEEQAKFESQLAVAKKQIKAGAEHLSTVRSKSNKIISQLSDAIEKGDRVCQKLRGSLEDTISAPTGVAKVCFEMLAKMKKQRDAHRLELKRAEDSQVTLSRDLGQEESSLKESLRKVKADKASAKKLKAEAENNSAIADKELQETTDDLESEKNKLSTQESTCTQTQSELSNVLTGLSKFKSAVTSSSVFAQRGTSFFQSNVIASMKRKAVALLQGRGSSPVFHKIVALLSASGPFDQVVHIISQAITNLEKEIGKHTSHSEYCTKKLAENEVHRTTHAAGIRKTRTEYEEIQGHLQEIQGQLTKADNDVRDITSGLSGETEMREEDKMANEAIIKEYSAAESAINEGVAALREGGLSDGNAGSLFAAIELVKNEIRKTIKQTEEQESAESSKFSLFRESSNKRSSDLSQKIHDLKMRSQKGTQDLSAVRKQHESFMGLLSSNMMDFDGLKQKCLSAGENFETRNAKRKEEIESLQEALRVLQGDEA